MNQINVLQLTTDSYLPAICGNSLVVKRFDEFFKSLGANTYVALDNNRDMASYSIYDGTEVFCPHGGDDRIKQTVKNIIEGKDINVILFHGSEYPRFIEPIKETENILKFYVSHYYTDKIEEWIKIFDGVITFQKTQYDRYKEKIPEEKIILSPHPVGDEFYNKGLERKPKSFLYLGRVLPAKGVHSIIPFLKDLDATYTILGPVENNYKEQIERIAKMNDALDRINFIEETLDREFLSNIYNTHEVFFLGSKSDCYSLVLSEALSCGMQAVVRYIKDAFDWAGDNITIYNNEEEEKFLKILYNAINKKTTQYDTAKYMKENYSYDAILKNFKKDFIAFKKD